MNFSHLKYLRGNRFYIDHYRRILWYWSNLAVDIRRLINYAGKNPKKMFYLDEQKKKQQKLNKNRAASGTKTHVFLQDKHLKEIVSQFFSNI